MVARGLIAAAAMVIAGSAVASGPVEYRIVRFDVEFSTTDGLPGSAFPMPDPVLGLGERPRYASAAFGINEDGVVVGMSNVDVFDALDPVTVVSRPFVWQPEPFHSAFGVNTMHPLAWWASGLCGGIAHGAVVKEPQPSRV